MKNIMKAKRIKRKKACSISVERLVGIKEVCTLRRFVKRLQLAAFNIPKHLPLAPPYLISLFLRQSGSVSVLPTNWIETTMSSGKRKGEELQPSDEERLQWSRDPEESWLSDWKIDIVVAGEKRATYNVHRAVLAVGPKRCEYFVRLLKNSNFAEANDKVTRIVDLNERHSKRWLRYA